MSERKKVMKCFTGNLDGTRRGLVCATSKVAAQKAVGTSRGDFNGYWMQTTELIEPAASNPEIVFVKLFDAAPGTPWTQRDYQQPKPPRAK